MSTAVLMATVLGLLFVGGGTYYVLNQQPSALLLEEQPTLQDVTAQRAQPTPALPVPKQQPPAQPATTNTIDTSNWRTFNDSRFSMRYPSEHNFVYGLCIKECTSESTKGTSDSYIEVEAEEVSNCYLGLCTATVQNRQTFNGVTWDYLGRQSYADAGASRSFYAYRAVYGGYNYHVLFNKDAQVNQTIMQSFTFEGAQSSSGKPAASYRVPCNKGHFIVYNLCESDMTAVDIAREDQARPIFEAWKATKGVYKESYGSDSILVISDVRYSVLLVNNGQFGGYIVVDLTKREVTDYFQVSRFIERTPQRLIFPGRCASQTGICLQIYTFGEEKSIVIQESELPYPQTYVMSEDSFGNQSFEVVSSSEYSVTLGVYDKTKSTNPVDTTFYERIGTKVINVSK